MSKTKIILLSILAAVVIFGMSTFSWVTGSYNSMITQREQVNTAWSEVETQYQRRYDLIPNLANATKGYLAHEQQVFKDIADARTQYAGAPTGSEAKVEATSGLEGALSRLLVIMENYPVLKADATVQSLMDELAGTENRVTVARSRYNEDVRDYNIDIKKFPRNFLAGVFNFDEKILFKVQTEEANQAPTVDLEVN